MALISKITKFEGSQTAVAPLQSRPTITFNLVPERAFAKNITIEFNAMASPILITINLNGEEITFDSIVSIEEELGLYALNKKCPLITRLYGSGQGNNNIIKFSIKDILVNNFSLSFRNMYSSTTTYDFYAVSCKASAIYLKEV